MCKRKDFSICFILQTVKLQTAEEVLDWGCSSVSRSYRRMGATIQVADNVPHGTIFTFTLQAEEVTLNE